MSSSISDFALPLHRAIKKIPHIDAAGNPVNRQPNGIKLKRLYLTLPLAEQSIILETSSESLHR